MNWWWSIRRRRASGAPTCATRSQSICRLYIFLIIFRFISFIQPSYCSPSDASALATPCCSACVYFLPVFFHHIVRCDPFQVLHAYFLLFFSICTCNAEDVPILSLCFLLFFYKKVVRRDMRTFFYFILWRRRCALFSSIFLTKIVQRDDLQVLYVYFY